MDESSEEVIQYTIGTSVLTSRLWTQFIINEIKRYRGWKELLKLMTALESELDQQEQLLRRRRGSHP